MSQSPVICDQKKSFCILIQASYRKHSLSRFRNQFHHCSVISVLRGAYVTGRLMKKVVHKLRSHGYRISQKLHPVLFCYLFLRFFHSPAVDLHQTFLYEFFYLASGSLSGIRQKFIQSHCFTHPLPLFFLSQQKSLRVRRPLL